MQGNAHHHHHHHQFLPQLTSNCSGVLQRLADTEGIGEKITPQLLRHSSSPGIDEEDVVSCGLKESRTEEGTGGGGVTGDSGLSNLVTLCSIR